MPARRLPHRICICSCMTACSNSRMPRHIRLRAPALARESHEGPHPRYVSDAALPCPEPLRQNMRPGENKLLKGASAQLRQSMFPFTSEPMPLIIPLFELRMNSRMVSLSSDCGNPDSIFARASVTLVPLL